LKSFYIEEKPTVSCINRNSVTRPMRPKNHVSFGRGKPP
jgi:hypothetical protein